jgi:hypothetical protein
MVHVRSAITTLVTFLLCASSPSVTTAQNHQRVIKATSVLVDVMDGGTFRKAQWRISPQLRPDVYSSHSRGQRVTFYTDIDSISVLVKPGEVSSFIILLNGKDSAFTEIRYVPTHLEILQASGGYDLRDHRVDLQFVYPSARDSSLVSLRQHFSLDSIAGHGSETDRLINVLHWVHTKFPHDGSKTAPASNGTEDLMTKCSEGNLTVDCGSLATILNACYSSLGYRSRRIVCLPEDSTDFDCHSINAVYVPSVGRWVWMDPTNDAYVMDEHGGLLGIMEVRERLIDGRPLRLNPDANWNHRVNVVASEYLYDYMAKNLFALQYYYETAGGTGAILLLPSTYEEPIPRTRPYHPVCTHNPDAFWGRTP